MPRQNRGPQLVYRTERETWEIVHFQSGRRRRISTGTPHYAEAVAVYLERQVATGASPLRETADDAVIGAIQRLHENARSRAARSRIGYALSEDDVAALFHLSGGRCQLTGIPFQLWLDADDAGGRQPWRPSIDRIDSSGSYQRHNCRLVCAAVNFALNEWGIEALERMAIGFLVTRHLALPSLPGTVKKLPQSPRENVRKSR